MTDHQPIPVKGYTAQPDDAVAYVNENKDIEERILRRLDALCPEGERSERARWRAIAKTAMQEAFMAFNRAVFTPERISLPEDEPK